MNSFCPLKLSFCLFVSDTFAVCGEAPTPRPRSCSCGSEPCPGSRLPWPAHQDAASCPRARCDPAWLPAPLLHPGASEGAALSPIPVPIPVPPRPTAPSLLPSASLTPPAQNLAPRQRFLQAECHSQAMEHLSAAVNPSGRAFGTRAVLGFRSLAGFHPTAPQLRAKEDL